MERPVATPRRNGSRQPPEVLAAASRRRHAASLTGLTSMGFIGAALRRRAWVWLAATFAGLVVSLGLFVVAPPAYQAQTSILITNDSTGDPAVAIEGDVELAQNPQVAEAAMVALADAGKPPSTHGLGGFAASYTATVASDRILQITTRADSNAEAIAEADAVTKAFLMFRAYTLREGQILAVSQITPLVNLRTKQFDTLSTLLTHVSAEPGIQGEEQNATPVADQVPARGDRARRACLHAAELSRGHDDGDPGHFGPRSGRADTAFQEAPRSAKCRRRAMQRLRARPDHCRDRCGLVRPAAGAR